MEKIISFNSDELFLISNAVISKIEDLRKISNWLFDNNIEGDYSKLDELICKYTNLLRSVNSVLEGKI